jgi:hypothetical protein
VGVEVEILVFCVDAVITVPGKELFKDWVLVTVGLEVYDADDVVDV